MEQEIDLLRQKILELKQENAILKLNKIDTDEAKELYLKIFDEFPALIWRSGLDKLCNYFNKTWLEFTGRTMEQEYGNGWAEGIHPDDFDFCLETYVTAFDKREPFLMEYRLKNRLGEYRWLRDFGRPFYDIDDTFLGYIGSCYDITENKDNEIRLVELNAAKDKFFSIIAHDLRSPFNSILGFSELILESIEEKDFDKVEEYTKIVLNSSKGAMDLLTNLMEWSLLQSGQMKYNPEYFDIVELIDKVKQFFQNIADQKEIHLLTKFEANIQIYADKEMTSIVLRNLISNAIKFTPDGGQIMITAVAEKDQLTVTVTDSGVGISSERIDTLFSVSENVSTYGTRNEKGTGMGLVLCKEFIEKNRGRIWVESLIGVGSTFSFTLPIK